MKVSGTISGNGSGLTNLNVPLSTTTVTASFNLLGGSFGQGVVNCANGWQVVGGGYSIPDSVWNLVTIVQSRPVGDGVGWRVRAASAAASSVLIDVWAVCAKLN